MKTLCMLAIGGLAAFCYFHDSTASKATLIKTAQSPAPSAALQTSSTVVAVAQTVVIASVPSYSNRWKSGLDAQTSLDYGQNAQTRFEPFTPDEQAHWNDNPGCTMVAGPALSRR